MENKEKKLNQKGMQLVKEIASLTADFSELANEIKEDLKEEKIEEIEE